MSRVQILPPLPNVNRSVAQPGSALAWGARSRRFKSCHSDHTFMKRKLSECSEAWYRTTFGTWGSPVQIWALRPIFKKDNMAFFPSSSFSLPSWQGNLTESDTPCPVCHNPITFNWTGTLDPRGCLGYVCKECGQGFERSNRTRELTLTGKWPAYIKRKTRFEILKLT